MTSDDKIEKYWQSVCDETCFLSSDLKKEQSSRVVRCWQMAGLLEYRWVTEDFAVKSMPAL